MGRNTCLAAITSRELGVVASMCDGHDVHCPSHGHVQLMYLGPIVLRAPWVARNQEDLQLCGACARQALS